MARGEVGWRWWFVQYIHMPLDPRHRIAAGFSRRPQMRHMPYHSEWMWLPRSVYPTESCIPKDLIEIAIWP